MPANEPVQQGPYPVPADPPDGPNQMSAIVSWAASRSAMRFASPAARDVAIPAPVDGMICCTGSDATLAFWVARSGTWTDMLAVIGPRRVMYAVKGSGSASLDDGIYDWMGGMATWTAIGPASAPPEFSYTSADRAGHGNAFIANVAGQFRLSASLQFESNNSGYRFMRILKSGTLIKKIGGPAVSAGRHCLNIDATATMAAGEIIGVQALQSSGAALPLYSGEDSRSIVMEYLGTLS